MVSDVRLLRMKIFACITAISTAIATGFTAETVRSPRFQDFAVPSIFKGKPTAVDFSRNPQARHYRTELRRQAAKGPDFAGHYKIAIWGCGSSCEEFAIIDSQNGRVYFPSELPYVTWTGYEGTNFGLQYRIDSRLLVLHGSPKEKPQIGTFYYLWQTNSLRLIQTELQK
jgi:hypothetical protein